MNANKLFKLLQNGEKSFINLEGYKKSLEQSQRVILDLSKFTNFNTFIDKSVKYSLSNGLTSPLDNLLIDVTCPEPINNRTKFLLHITPIEISTDVSTFHIMLVQDMNHINNDIYPRSHIVAMEQNEILRMPVTDEGMKDIGCKCFLKNPFSHGLIFKQIQSFTPGFKADCGFAMYNCVSKMPTCLQLLAESIFITNLAIALTIYIGMPYHRIIKVSDTDQKQDGLKQMNYYMVCDEKAWNNTTNDIKSSDNSEFINGNDFDKYISEKFTLTTTSHINKNMEYKLL